MACCIIDYRWARTAAAQPIALDGSAPNCMIPETKGGRGSASDPGQWGTFALLRLNAYGFGINGLMLAMDVMVLPALVLVLVSDEVKNTYLGLMGFSGLVLAAVVQLGIGPISDRTNTRLGKRVPFIVWGAAFILLGLGAVGFAPNFIVLFAAWLFIQSSINIGYGPYQALIQDLVPVNRMGWASSLKILADAAGALVLILVSGELIGQATGSEPGVWLWLALGFLGVCLVASTWITSLTVLARERISNGSQGAAAAEQPKTRRKLHPQLPRFVLSRLMLVIAMASFQTYGMFFLKDVAGLDNPAQALGRMIVIIGGSLAISVYVTGRLSDRMGRKPLVVLGALGAAASTILMLATSSTGQVMIVASLIGISVGALLSADWALANELGTSGREALHMGIINLANIGGAGLSKLMGPGIDALNRMEPVVQLWGFSYAVTGYTAMLISCALLFLCGAALLLPLKPDAHQGLPTGPLPQNPA